MRVVTMALIELNFWASLIIALVFAFLSHWIWWLSYACPFILLFTLYLAVVRIPLNLNWSRNLYPLIFYDLIIFNVSAIVIYAIIYFQSEQLGSQFHGFDEALYFSVTTWTTLGYGDITPPRNLKLITSAEALTGLITIPVIVAVIWLYCQDRIRPRSSDEGMVGELKVRLESDKVGNTFRDLPEERARYKEAFIRRINVNPCSHCGAKDISVERHYDIVGRLVPLPMIVIRCEKCGHFSKPRHNAYIAAWNWNRGKLEPHSYFLTWWRKRARTITVLLVKITKYVRVSYWWAKVRGRRTGDG